MKSKKKVKKVKAKKTKDAAPTKLKVVNIKVSSKDRRALIVQAKLYAQGNLSAWLRFTGLRYALKRGEIVPQPSNRAAR